MYSVTTAQLIGIGSVIVAFVGTLVWVMVMMIKNGDAANSKEVNGCKDMIKGVDAAAIQRMTICQENMQQKFDWVKGSVTGLYKQTNETNANLMNLRGDVRVIAKVMEMQDKKLFNKARDKVKKESDNFKKPIIM